MKIAEAYLHHITIQHRRNPIFREKCQLLGTGFPFLKNLNGFAPGGLLGLVDFSKVQYLSLDMPISMNPPVFDDAPIAVDFAIFTPSF